MSTKRAQICIRATAIDVAKLSNGTDFNSLQEKMWRVEESIIDDKSLNFHHGVEVFIWVLC